MAALPEELRGRWNHNTHYFPLALAAPPGERAVDIGCGDGLLLRLLAPRYSEVVGVDPWTPADACADVPNVRIVRADFLTVALEPADLVTCMTAIHHLDVAAALRKMVALTRPGGRLLVVGVARYTPWSYLLGGLGIVPHRIMARRRGWCSHPAPRQDPQQSLGEIRAIVRAVVPDAAVRRHLYWRYSISRTRPG